MNGSKINIIIFMMFAVASGSIRLSMPSHKNVYDDIDLSQVEQTLANIEYGDYTKNEKTNILYQSNITKIVLHHTATNPNQHPKVLFGAINNAHSKRRIRGGIQKTGQQMMYHRLIGSDGTIRGDKDFNEIGWGTKNNNDGVIHIALQGDFNKNKPTEQQYMILKQTIDSLKSRYGNIVIMGHGQLEEEATACPGKLFDYTRIIDVEPKPITVENVIQTAYKSAGIETPTDKSYNILFSLSRYYSPEKGQSKYFRGSYEDDVIMNCGASAIGNNDCLYPASGIRYTMSNKNKSVACPPNYRKGQKIGLRIQGKEHIVTCEDRGSAIQGSRLDMYCGIGQYAVDNWSTCITGKIYGKIL